PGSMQARGDNLFSLMKSFSISSQLLNAHERKSKRVASDDGSKSTRPVFFDVFVHFMVFYSRQQAVVVHIIPFVIFLLVPIRLHSSTGSVFRTLVIYYDFIKGLLHHAVGIMLAILFPVAFAILRLLFTVHSMHWYVFASPYLAFLLYVPCSVMGLLFPIFLRKQFPLSPDASSLSRSHQQSVEEAGFWGAFGFYALLTLAYFSFGSGGGFVTFIISAFMLPAWVAFRLSVTFFGYKSLRSTTCYVVPLLPCLAYSLCFGGFLIMFVIEKMGAIGSLPPPYGYFVPDVIVAAVVGLVTGWCVGPLLPVVGNGLALSSVFHFLLHGTVLALAFSSQVFPYSKDAPKRVVFQLTVRTVDSSQISGTSFDLAVVDSNSLSFVFKHAPRVVKALHGNREMSLETVPYSDSKTWKGLFPICDILFARTLKFETSAEDITNSYTTFPHLSVVRSQVESAGRPRRVNFEFSLGSLKEVWVAVLNITGPLSNWSFANHDLPAPTEMRGGSRSYVCRLSGSSHETWEFWLEVENGEPLAVDVAVLDLHLTESAEKVKGLFPGWMDVVALTSFVSSYV
ncbi:hypothetical protein M569_01917, partial [Genlisea aurea]